MSDQQYKQALPSGYELRGYRLHKVLGVGGFGVTYLAEHLALGRRVAIKEYLPNEIAVRQGTGVYPKSEADRGDFEWGLARFLDEAKTLARFEHRNLVQVRDYFEANRTAFIVMDYEDGEPLDRLLARHGVLTEIQLRRVLLPIAEGLREVHAAGYLHRDIKPSNVFVRRSDESPVLLDFGAARQALGRKSRSLTAMASEGYSPPEQYESEGEQGPWTDIYALSALCFRAITGNAPIEAPRRLSRIARGQPDPLPMLTETLREGFSQSLLTAVDAGLRIVETKRPASLDEWLALLSAHSSVSSAQSEAAARLSDDASKATAEKGESSAFRTGYRVGKRARRATKRFVGLRAYDQLSRARIWLIGAVVMVAIAAFYTSPFWFGLLAGATGATYVVSLILRGIFLRRVEPPKKQILSTLIAIPVCGIISAFGAADGGEPRFLEGFTTYGIAGLILMAFQVLGSLTRERKSRENERELPMWATRKWLIGALALVAAVGLWYYVSNDGTKETGIGNESLPGYLSDTQTPAVQPSPDKPRKLGSEAGASPADGAPERPTTSPVLDATSQPFTIEVRPHAAGVRILNIRPVYEPGMRLPAGNYQVEVSAAGYETAVETVRHETGRATVHRVVLQLPRLPASGKVAGKLEPGDLELESGEYADIWIVRAQAGQTLSADLISREFDAVIYLVDSQGNPIAQDDDSGQDTDARLSLRLDDSGRYPIFASSFSDGAVGDYELVVDLSSSADGSELARQSDSSAQSIAFTRGSHEDDVIRLQGTPTSVQRYAALGHEVWFFGGSRVEISTTTRQVTQWANHAGNLKVQLPPGPNTTSSATFTRGSHEDDVLRLQGTPTSVQRYAALGHEVWFFGGSRVEISTTAREVTQWANHAGNLKVRLPPGPNTTSSATFTRGSHEDDVLRLQGTPTSVQRYAALGHEVWFFGGSRVEISTTTRQVTQWANYAGNLKVRLEASRPN